MIAKTFFIADTCFNNTNIIKIHNRTFTSSEDQTNKLIENWNSVAKDEDTIFILGDFFYFYNPIEWNKDNTHIFVNETNECTKILSQLKGHKHLIKGDYDVRSNKQYIEMGFESVSQYPIIYNDFFILSHKPLFLSNTTPYFNLYGYAHNDTTFEDTSTSSLTEFDRVEKSQRRSKCVSVERINYTPISLEKIKLEIDTHWYAN